MRTRPLDEQLFDRLADRHGTDLISIYMPTHRKGRREIQQDSIRFKNLVSEAEVELEAHGWRTNQRSDRLETLRQVLDDREFWEHQLDGLAVFVDGEGEVDAVSLGKEPGSSVWVGPVFRVRPLLAGLSAIRAHTLVLTRGAVGLFLVGQGSAAEIQADLPGSFDDVNWFVDRERQRQQHPDQVGTSRSRHGHDPNTKADEDVWRFLREVASALPPAPGDTPLVVLGDDDLVARFAQVTERPVASPEHSGLFGPVTEAAILERTDPVIADLEEEKTERLRSQMIDAIGQGTGTHDISEALTGALSGRVAEVAVDWSADPVWGRIDEAGLEVEVVTEPGPPDVDLLDRLVVLARRTGASTHALPGPIDAHPFVATLRY